MLENLTFFSLNRYLYKKLMSFNGITNLLIIMINNDYASKDYQEFDDIMVFSSLDELDSYQWGSRLEQYLRQGYFNNGSKLFAYIADKEIAGFTWLHFDFDPNGDVTSLGKKNYHLAGPTFVNIKHRGKRISGKLKNAICSFAKKHTKYPIYAVNSFDNIPIIKNNYKEGYRLHNLIIKLKNKEIIIL